jgi:hypothetical protein
MTFNYVGRNIKRRCQLANHMKTMVGLMYLIGSLFRIEENGLIIVSLVNLYYGTQCQYIELNRLTGSDFKSGSFVVDAIASGEGLIETAISFVYPSTIHSNYCGMDTDMMYIFE